MMTRILGGLLLVGALLIPVAGFTVETPRAFDYDCNSTMLFINFKTEAWINKYETKINVEKMMIPLAEVKNVYLMEDQRSVVVITDYLNSFSRFDDMEQASRFMSHVYQCLNLVE